MKIIKRIFAPKEVKVTLNIIEELSLEWGYTQAFREIRSEIERSILDDYKNVVSQVKDGASARQLIYFSIAFFAARCVKSGRYHIWTGVLTGIGSDLLSLFDMAIDRLLESGAISEKEAKEQKAGIREIIEYVG